MIDIAYFEANLVKKALEPLLDLGKEVVVSHDSERLNLVIPDWPYEALLRFDVSKLGYYRCKQVASTSINLETLHIFLDHNKGHGKCWVRLRVKKPDVGNGAVLEFYSSSGEDWLEELLPTKVYPGFVDIPESYKYRIAVQMRSADFRKIIETGGTELTMTIRARNVWFPRCNISLTAEDGGCRIRGGKARPYSFTMYLHLSHKVSFVDASELASQVCIHIKKPNATVLAMFEFTYPPLGSYRFYYHGPNQRSSVPDRL